MTPHYPVVADRAGHRCEYCHAPEVVYNFPFEVEHIVPPGKGGDETHENLALSCRSCNVHKSDRTEFQDSESGINSRLFNPRSDAWNAHFEFDANRGVLSGRTSIGRATVACLQINSAAQQFARQQWVRLNLFP